MRHHVSTPVLDIAFDQYAEPSGWPVVLLHGFPYDVHVYEDVGPLLAAQGARVVVPFLRGYGDTRYRHAATLRSGQQGALGADLLALLDALNIERAILGGHDWGGRAACIVSALWPERVAGLATVNGYNIQDIAGAAKPMPPESEHRAWYVFYFQAERGRRGLAENRRPLCRLLWQLWSPTWAFDDATFERSAAAFDNPDFVETVIHSYRHRHGLVAGDPAYEEIERRLAARPSIGVPTVHLDGLDDGVSATYGGSSRHAEHFTGGYEHRQVEGAGHNLPQEKPAVFAQAILDLRGMNSR